MKPLDSVARNSLLVIRGAQTFQHEGRTIGPTEWLLDVLFRPDVSDAQPVFQIDDPDVLGLLGMPQTSQRRFAFTVIAPHLQQVDQQATAASRIDSKQRTRFQRAVTNLAERVYLYFRLEEHRAARWEPRAPRRARVAGVAQRGAAARGARAARRVPALAPEAR